MYKSKCKKMTLMTGFVVHGHIYHQGRFDMCTETETASGFCGLVGGGFWLYFFHWWGLHDTVSIYRMTHCFTKKHSKVSLLFQWMFISSFTIVSVVTWTSFRLKSRKRLGFFSVVRFQGSLHFLCNFLFVPLSHSSVAVSCSLNRQKVSRKIMQMHSYGQASPFMTSEQIFCRSKSNVRE